MQAFLQKIFGANFQTTLWGFITLVASSIAIKPDLIAFLPDSFERYVSGVAGLIAFVSGGAFAIRTKDRNVTGGTVQQTADGNIASHDAQIRSSSVTDTKEAAPNR